MLLTSVTASHHGDGITLVMDFLIDTLTECLKSLRVSKTKRGAHKVTITLYGSAFLTLVSISKSQASRTLAASYSSPSSRKRVALATSRSLSGRGGASMQWAPEMVMGARLHQVGVPSLTGATLT